jgi:lipoprotein-anchoring transpeptidase ErfK/SrfK
MKTTTEKTGKTTTLPKLIICLTAMTLLYSVSGCSTAQPTAVTSDNSAKSVPGMTRKMGDEGPMSPTGTRGPTNPH